MRISDCSSDVCSSDLEFIDLLPGGAIGPIVDLPALALGEGVIGIDAEPRKRTGQEVEAPLGLRLDPPDRRHLVAVRRRRPGDEVIFGMREIGRASCRARVCQYV